MIMVYKGVIFDVGGVLVSSPLEAIRDYAKMIGIHPRSVSRAVVDGQPYNSFCRLERGEIVLSQFAAEFDKECFEQSQSKEEEFPQGFSASELFSFISSQSRLNLQLLHVAQKLKALGYKTCALTNNWIGFDSDIPLTLHSHFDVVIESCRVGIRKPNQAIYTLACTKLKVQPSEVVFLDDLGANLKSAKQMGMSTIKVSSTRNAIEELEQILQIKLNTNAKL